VDTDGLWGCVVLLQVMAGPGVHGQWQLTVAQAAGGRYMKEGG
jgi:hypothetical protein